MTARNVLMFIVQVTDVKNPLKPSWAHKETIAHHLGIGEATVYRMLNVLIENDFIERLEQERKSRNGRFAVARIRLTPACCTALGLSARNHDTGSHNQKAVSVPSRDTSSFGGDDGGDSVENMHIAKNINDGNIVCLAAAPRVTAERPAARGETFGDSYSPAPKMIDGHMDILPSADQQTQSAKQSRPAGCQKPRPGQHYLRVPREFFWLIDERRLSAPQTCKLMREFSSRGQRLGDAVTLLANRLRELPKDKTYAYLASLANGKTDFAWLRAERERSRSAAKQATAARKQAQSLQHLVGTYLLSSNGTHLFRLRGSGHAEAWWMVDGAMRQGSQPVNADFAEAYAEGRLSEIAPDRAAMLLSQWRRIN